MHCDDTAPEPGWPHRCDRRWPRLLCPGICPWTARPPAHSPARVATAQAGDGGRTDRVSRVLPAARDRFECRFDAGGRADRTHPGNVVFTLDRCPGRQPDHRVTSAFRRGAPTPSGAASLIPLGLATVQSHVSPFDGSPRPSAASNSRDGMSSQCGANSSRRLMISCGKERRGRSRLMIYPTQGDCRPTRCVTFDQAQKGAVLRRHASKPAYRARTNLSRALTAVGQLL